MYVGVFAVINCLYCALEFPFHNDPTSGGRETGKNRGELGDSWLKMNRFF